MIIVSDLCQGINGTFSLKDWWPGVCVDLMNPYWSYLPMGRFQIMAGGARGLGRGGFLGGGDGIRLNSQDSCFSWRECDILMDIRWGLLVILLVFLSLVAFKS